MLSVILVVFCLVHKKTNNYGEEVVNKEVRLWDSFFIGY